MAVLKNALGLSHEMIAKVVRPGDTVIDATAGNGKDTLFLADLVGDIGRVYAFDIQQRALESTAEKLKKCGFLGRVCLIHDSHHKMQAYVEKGIKAVMFNLGYLPGGDHRIATRPETTVEAIKQAAELIVVNGMISIVIYYGGDTGFKEKDCVLSFLTTMDYKRFSVMKTEFMNQINCPPIHVCIEKLFD